MFTFRARTFLAFLVLALGASVVLITAGIDSASAQNGQVAPEAPRRDVPIVLDGVVYKSVQLHDRVIVAGEFTQVQATRGGAVVNRSNIFAYDINTGELIDDFTPNVNKGIFAMIADPANDALYIGGTFTQVDGEFRVRVAKLDYDGSLDGSFNPDVSAKVQALELAGNVVFVGGNFSQVNGQGHDRIAAVNASTGNTVTDFQLQVRGDLGRADTRSVKALDLHPDGERLLVAFNGASLIDADGVSHDRFGVAFIDVDDYSVLPWRTEWFENSYQRCSSGALQLRDAELSPDGSTFALVEKGNWTCDKIVAFDTFDDGDNSPKWVTAAHDSVFSVAITDTAVYAGGHFCFVTAHGPIDSDDAPSYPWGPKPEECVAGGNDSIDEFTARYQIAALNPADGEPLDWNPGTNVQEAVFDIEAIDRGLLLGLDRDRVNTILTGRHAFLDFGGTTPPFIAPVAPPAPVLECTATARPVQGVELEWTEAQGTSTPSVRRNGAWIASTTDTSYFDQPGAGSHEYVIRYRVDGVPTDVSCNPSPIVVEPIAQVCAASVVGGEVNLSWPDHGASTYQVRRNGAWLATTEVVNHYVDTGVAPGEYTYEIRFRTGGATTDIACNPSPISIEGEALTCGVSVDGAEAAITWNHLDGVSTYQVRRNDRWLATTGNNFYSDFDGVANATYELRYRQGGQTTTIACQ